MIVYVIYDSHWPVAVVAMEAEAQRIMDKAVTDILNSHGLVIDGERRKPPARALSYRALEFDHVCNVGVGLTRSV